MSISDKQNNNNNLNSLARTLAECLILETDNFGDCSLETAIDKAEIVVREAIEKTLEEACNATCALCKKDTPIVNYGQQHRLKKSCTPVEFYYVDCLAAAIRSLKPVKLEKESK